MSTLGKVVLVPGYLAGLSRFSAVGMLHSNGEEVLLGLAGPLCRWLLLTS